MTASARTIDRVLKMRARAQNTSSANEADVAMKLAMDLMLAHAITEADLEAAATRTKDPLIQARLYLDGLVLVPYESQSLRHRKTAPWKRSLVTAIATYFGLRYGYYAGRPRMNLYGHQSDVAAAIDLYAVCARQIERKVADHLRVRREADPYLPAGELREIAVAFRASAVEGLKVKFAKLSRETEAALDTASAYGLVLTRKKKVSDWVDATYTFVKPTAKDASAFVDLDVHGYNAAGYEAGQNLSLIEDRALSGTKTAEVPKLAGPDAADPDEDEEDEDEEDEDEEEGDEGDEDDADGEDR